MSEIAVQEQQELSPRQRLHQTITSEQQLAEFKAALPENVSVDKFRRALSTAVNEKPELIEVFDQNPRSLFSALSKCASAGLLPDGKQAAINVYKTKQKQPDGSEQWVPTAQFLPMIAGLRYILAQYGWTQVTKVVYANDDFDYSEQPPEIRHRPLPPHVGERGDRVAVYAVSTHRDGRRVQTILWPEDVDKRRKKAKTDKIWNEWTDQMWEKSAGHANFDDVPLDESATERIRRLLAETTEGPADDLLYGRKEIAAVPPGGAATDADANVDGGDGGPQAALSSSPEDGAAPGSFDYSSLAGESGETHAAPAAASGDVSASPAPAEIVAPDTLKAFAGKTIAEIADSDAGRRVLLAVLLSPARDEFRTAVEAYAQTSAPEVWKAYCDAKFGSEL